MKNLIITLIFLLISNTFFAQQLMWTTEASMDKSGKKTIKYKEIDEKTLEYYDHYEFHYDYSGFDMDGFIELMYEVSGKDLQFFANIENPISLAMRVNDGEGSSVVMVIFLGKDYGNMIFFSNEVKSNFIMNMEHDRPKFKKWLKSLHE